MPRRGSIRTPRQPARATAVAPSVIAKTCSRSGPGVSAAAGRAMVMQRDDGPERHGVRAPGRPGRSRHSWPADAGSCDPDQVGAARRARRRRVRPGLSRTTWMPIASEPAPRSPISTRRRASCSTRSSACSRSARRSRMRGSPPTSIATPSRCCSEPKTISVVTERCPRLICSTWSTGRSSKPRSSAPDRRPSWPGRSRS